ncbi:quinoprotein dehydrogenase-associated SoxYZ-like carrier [Qipengyuania soli]|uniref:Quinoprotein dehydrogenase-associated SoxYZ-like carrier n=1 Tax=Qipengyuania soli TaxID=2782568 RepID=A0A7S8F312_9SPHN|nr:quinoprotein dehydrogenase-associated SoxYZ-like carrier [Qipengyuania soli]QPC98053.1 quinoprotein dehydrogenase-associated SoxYZ-like carrier [Qipengyuania soli]
MRRILIVIAALVLPAMAQAGEPDPLGSPMWDFHAAQVFEGASYTFDDAVKVELPVVTENQHVMPVTVDARALGEVRRIVLFADLNPIPIALDYRPLAAEAFVATRIKLDQRTPVRAAVLTADGLWHVSGGWVDAAGGGCSAPPVSRVKGDWADHLGEMRGAAWAEGEETRLRFGFRHPMDTGLVENIPGYNIDTVKVRDAGGTLLADMTIYGSVSEDPSFTLIVEPKVSGKLDVAARDTNGLEFSGSLDAATGRRLAAARP